MYQNNYSSKLSKFAVMSLGICAVFVSSFQQVFAGKKAIYVKVSDLSNYESVRYRSSSFSLNKS